MKEAPKMPLPHFEPHECISCFMPFGAPVGFDKKRREDCKTFWCPGCGSPMAYSKGDTELDKLRRERDNLKQQAARRDDEIAAERREREAAEVRAAAAERKVKRVEKRAYAGLCPCCNRTFSELAKHIATKHPTFRAEDVSREKVVSIVKAKAG